jgi:uncharacterized protein
VAYKIEFQGLELKTKDGNNILGSDFDVEIKEVDESTRSFWAIASTETEDRDRDIIRIDGWDLKNFKKNPAGLWSHNYYEHPHFKAEKIKIDKNTKQLLFKPIFDTHDKANISYNQYKNGFLSMFSVGFNPIKYEFRNPDEWFSGREFTKQELLEISCVAVPANPEAGILRSAGLMPDIVNLVTLGYSEEYKILEDGRTWFPITGSLKGYKEPREFKLGNGVTAVSAIPIYNIDSKNHPAIGYIFDNTFSSDDINGWLKSNDINKSIKKYYVIKDNFTLELSEEEKDILILEKKSPQCPDDMEPDDDGNCPMEDNSSCENVKGCGRKPKPKSVDEIEFKEDDFDEIIEAKDFLAENEKPYPNEHACRINSPDNYDKFARKNCAQKHDDKCIDVIYGIKDGKSEIQALRYKKDTWSAEDAKSHCSTRGGTFEAAKSEEDNFIPGITTNSFDAFLKLYNLPKDLKTEEDILQLFDKSITTIINTKLEEFKKDILEEIKKLVNVEKDLNDSGNDNFVLRINDSEFESLVSQDEKSDTFVINPDEIRNLEIDSKTLEDKVTFIFDETLKNILENN